MVVLRCENNRTPPAAFLGIEKRTSGVRGCSTGGSYLLLSAFIKWRAGNREGVALAADIHFYGGAFFQVGISVDQRQCNGMAQSRRGLTGGHCAHDLVTQVDFCTGARGATLRRGQGLNNLLRAFF